MIGPLFYEGNLNGERYCQMLEKQITPQIRENYGAQFGNVHVVDARWSSLSQESVGIKLPIELTSGKLFKIELLDLDLKESSH